MTVRDATYGLLRQLGLTTVFGNPGSTDAFGRPGVVNMVYLIGNYLTTSALLNAFDVPVPAAPPLA